MGMCCVLGDRVEWKIEGDRSRMMAFLFSEERSPSRGIRKNLIHRYARTALRVTHHQSTHCDDH